jgi:hypothetical protein
VIEDTERLTGCEIERAYVDKGYRGHRAANPRRVFISGQKRGAFGVIKRELRRRCAIEAVIGHMKSDGHLGPLPSQGPPRRCRQRHPHRRRPQSPTRPGLAQRSPSPNRARAPAGFRNPVSTQIGFLTDD